MPEAYYKDLWDRVGDIPEDHEAIRELNILVDHDEKGYLLQLFTRMEALLIWRMLPGLLTVLELSISSNNRRLVRLMYLGILQ